MYRRLIILSVIILAALCGLACLGYHSIHIWARGIEGTRIGEFAEVAEQIRQDVKDKLDKFMEAEQNRDYTEYQNYYVPDNVVAGQQQMPLLRSPLAGSLEHGLAYNSFQIDPDGTVITPNDDILSDPQYAARLNVDFYAEVDLNRKNIEDNVLPILHSRTAEKDKSALIHIAPNSFMLAFEQKTEPPQKAEPSQKAPQKVSTSPKRKRRDISPPSTYSAEAAPAAKAGRSGLVASSKYQRSRAGKYPIESLQNPDQKAQIIKQAREVFASNVAQSTQLAEQQGNERPSAAPQRYTRGESERLKESYSYSSPQWQLQRRTAGTSASLDELGQQELSQPQAAQVRQTTGLSLDQQLPAQQAQADMVEIRIEPFVPLVVPGKANEHISAISAEASIFDGQVFMLRHVQIEDEHFIQGFQLNEGKLIEEIKESAKRFMREDMDFELAQTTNGDVAYAAILDFGFGNLVLNLLETNPDWIAIKIGELRNWYFSIITVVLVAVMLGLAGLWRNARAQLKLAQKKDDFISAVSHELRTPLTSIRMYSEMLEKDWVKSPDKKTEYYNNMRQESERLSRLIENVLDFSRIQRGRKKYTFTLGEINKCIADVVEMMRPYAAQNGFSIKTKFEHFGQAAFDGDAVTQIVVNLLDNAIKYARNAEDKTITVRTKNDDRFVLIEVEDHGPGVPLRQRKKIFEEFYRVGAEATRETTGTGLGLALVKKFAQAHNGFVEILNARPTGAIFRVALATQT